MRGICAAILVMEALVLFFATLVAVDLTEVDHTLLWSAGGGGALVCVLLAGLLRRPWAYVAGSVVQVLLIAAGFVVPAMFFIGLLFAALWILAIHLGRKVARLQAASAGPAEEGG